MFNGIIYNTGSVKDIKKYKNSIYVGIQRLVSIPKILDHQFVVMEYV